MTTRLHSFAAALVALLLCSVSVAQDAQSISPNYSVSRYSRTVTNGSANVLTYLLSVGAPDILTSGVSVTLHAAATVVPAGTTADLANSIVSFTPSVLAFVGPGDVETTNVTISLPQGVPAGDYIFVITTTGWPADVDTSPYSTVDITVTNPPPPAVPPSVSVSDPSGGAPIVVTQSSLPASIPFNFSATSGPAAPISGVDADLSGVPLTLTTVSGLNTSSVSAAGTLSLGQTDVYTLHARAFNTAGVGQDAVAFAFLATTPPLPLVLITSPSTSLSSVGVTSYPATVPFSFVAATDSGSPVISDVGASASPLFGSPTAAVTKGLGSPCVFGSGTFTAGASGLYNVAVSATNSAGTAYSATRQVAVVLVPSITSQPQSQSVVLGGSATFSVSYSGDPSTIQWLKDGVAISGANTTTLTVANVRSADAGSYAAVVRNDGGSVTSSTAELTVLLPPTITQQPQGMVVAQGASLTFSVGASGTAPLTYQWQFNGAAIPGATSATLYLSNVAPSNDGSYSVVVSNGVGSVTSSSAALNVLVAPPVITLQPADQNLATGSSATLSVVATSAFPLSYQWYRNGATISGAVAPSYTIANAQLADSGGYYVVVTNAGVSATSRTAAVGVYDPPVITVQPQSQTAFEGDNVTFNIAATGSVLQYQWYAQPPSGIAARVSGAMSASLTLNSVQPSDSADYDVVVQNPVGNATSGLAHLTVYGPPALSSVSPATAVSGASDLQITVSGATFAPSSVVSWNGANLTTTYVDANTLQAIVPAADLVITGSTTIVPAAIAVTNPHGIVSNALSFTITAPDVGSVQSTTTPPNTSTTVTTDSSSSTTDPVTVSTTLQNNSSTSGATVSVATYTDNPATVPAIDVGGQYVDVQIANAASTDTATSRLYYPASITGTAETSLQLMYYDGSAWQPVLSSGGLAPVQDTTDNLDGTTSGGRFTVVFDSTSTPQITQLTGTVFTAGTAPKKNAYKEKPKVVADPSSLTVKVGGTATFKVTAVSVLGVTYQWYVDGKKSGAIPGATGPTLVLKNVSTSDSGTYFVVVTNANGSTTSKKAKLSVISN